MNLYFNLLKPPWWYRFYLKDYINYVERTDFDFSSVGDFETSFIEIKFPKKKNW